MNPVRKALIAGALAATTLGGGALGATLVSGTASAQTNPSTTTAPSTSSDSGATAPDNDGPGGRGGHGGPGGGHTANGITEKALTGDVATKVKAAVDQALPGSTIERMENDAEGAVYEAHVTKADGSNVTVKLDANFAITGTVTGHG